MTKGKVGETDRNVGVLVEDDLKEVRGEYRWGFETLLRSEEVLLLPIRPWGGAGQICEIEKFHTFYNVPFKTNYHIKMWLERRNPVQAVWM